jgi:hypothetical protein
LLFQLGIELLTTGFFIRQIGAEALDFLAHRVELCVLLSAARPAVNSKNAIASETGFNTRRLNFWLNQQVFAHFRRD